MNVLRLQTGDEISVTGGDGWLHRCLISGLSRKEALADIVHSEYQENPYNCHVYIGQLKHPDRMEWMVEKLTEIGVFEIGLIQSELSEKRNVKPERLNRVAISAMKQSLKTHLPAIQSFKNIREALAHAGEKSILIAHCYDDLERKPMRLVQKKKDPIVMFIGPEGDFSREEVNLALESGAVPVSLGDTRLRTETAAMVALALLNDKND